MAPSEAHATCGVRMKFGRRTSSSGWPFLRRLDGQHVEAGARDQPLVERLNQRRLIDQSAAGGVDEQGIALHFAKRRDVDQVARRRQQRAVQRDHVGLREHLSCGVKVTPSIFGGG